MTQSDPGSENVGIANAHTSIRHRLDPSLSGTIQHKWCRGHSNIKPEIAWSQLRAHWSAGFEEILELGLSQGLYDTSIVLHQYVHT